MERIVQSPKVLLSSLVLLATACANTTPIQPAATSKSKFEGAVYTGEALTLGKPTPGVESFRVFQKGATGFVALASVRADVEQLAAAHCDITGQRVHGLVETDAKPPYILGNFPRVELVFECLDKPQSTGVAPEISKYEKLAQLKKLLENGTLTQQEFDVEKAKVLAQP